MKANLLALLSATALTTIAYTPALAQDGIGQGETRSETQVLEELRVLDTAPLKASRHLVPLSLLPMTLRSGHRSMTCPTLSAASRA